MWETNVTIINNTDFTITMANNFLPSQTITAYNSFGWTTLDTPNTTSLKFWITEGEVTEFQSGLQFGSDCGVWADRGYMESPSVIMDTDVNGYVVTQELNGGQTIVEDFSMGGNITLTFRNKVFTQEFRLG